MSKLPPFHSKRGGRTRPPRRRPDPITLTTRELMRQKSLSKAFLAVAVLVAIVSLVAAALTRGDEPAPAGAVTVPGALLVDVVRIVDGDTIDVRAAQTELRVRLYGVDTPERGDRCFAEATDRTRALAGSQVQLLPDARLRDRYDRELRYVYTARGESIDAALVREGLALAWREDGSQRDALVSLEGAARAAKTGCLWGGS